MNKKALLGMGAIALAFGAIAASFSGNKATEVKADWNPYIYNVGPTRSIGQNTIRWWWTTSDSNVTAGSAKFAAWIVGGTYNNHAYWWNTLSNGYDTTKLDDTVYYLDVPADAEKITFIRVNPTPVDGSADDNGAQHQVWNELSGITLSDSGWVLRSCMHYVWFSDSNLAIGKSSGYWNAKPTLLKEVLSDYATCETTASDVQTLYGQFMKNRTTDSLETTHLDGDYSRADYKENKDNYDGLSIDTSVTPTVQEKWEGLCEATGINPEDGTTLSSAFSLRGVHDNRALETTLAASGVVAIGLASAAGLFFLRKKRHN